MTLLGCVVVGGKEYKYRGPPHWQLLEACSRNVKFQIVISMADHSSNWEADASNEINDHHRLPSILHGSPVNPVLSVFGNQSNLLCGLEQFVRCLQCKFQGLYSVCNV